MLKKACLYLFLLSAFCETASFAQNFLPVCRNFGPEDYSEDAEFRCAASDNKGTLYFGTNYGIMVYKGEKRSSGKNWRFLLLPQPDVISSLYMDTLDKRLYVGGQHDFGYFELKDAFTGVFVSLKGKMTEQTSDIWHIEKCGRTIVFHSLDKLIYLNDGAVGAIEPWNNGIFHNVFKTSAGTLLINGLEGGWFYFTPSKKFALMNVTGQKIPPDKCYSVLATGNNRYLFFFRNSGIYEVTFDGESFSRSKKISGKNTDEWLAAKQVYRACFSYDSSKIILGTLAGGAYLVDNSDSLSSFTILSEMQNTTGIISVYGLFTDPNMNTWLLGKRNLSLLPSDLSLAHESFSGITIRSLAETGNELFVASGNGLYRLSQRQGLFTDPKSISPGAFNKIALVGDTLYASAGNLLVRYYKGKTNTYESPLPINDISCVRNSIWISTQNGLFNGVQNLLSNTAIIYDKNILQAAQAQSLVYVLVNNEGLIELNDKNERSGEYPLDKDLSSTQNAKLFVDKDKILLSNLYDTYELDRSRHAITGSRQRSKLWMYKVFSDGRKVKFEFDSTNSTLLQLCEPGGTAFKKANSFMSAVEINDAAFSNGYYYLATKSGLFVSKLQINKPQEIVRIFKLTADTQSFGENEPARISYNNHRSILASCALNSFYSSFSGTHYLYRLVPYDTAWSVQATSEIFFNNLPWGDYVLEVKAKYGNGQETETAFFRFTILKPWWVSWWGILLWVLLFILFVYTVVQISVYRLKRSKIKLEKIVEERTAEVVHQKNEIEEQKEEIEHKNQEITDSINYAQRIQNSLLKDESKLQASLPGTFVLYLPKDIVSGDFYWFYEIQGHTLLAVADCTGHGVPGAFMSMLGVAKLNELAAKNIFMPDKLLHELNHLIVETLGQNTANSDSRDGMDIALLSFDKKNKKLFYAGANRPLYLVNKKDNSFSEIKPTKLPVGGGQYGEHRDYDLHEVPINSNLSIYLCTDGYADQFGGPQGKKLMSKRLQELLIKIAGLPPAQQKEKLKDMYMNWKGKLEQIDDVCVAGINFTD